MILDEESTRGDVHSREQAAEDVLRERSAGTRVDARWASAPPAESRDVWLGLVPQSGVAIGFAALVALAFGDAGAAIRTLLLALIAVNTAVGPVLSRLALARAGELRHDRTTAPAIAEPPSPPA